MVAASSASKDAGTAGFMALLNPRTAYLLHRLYARSSRFLSGFLTPSPQAIAASH
jgi:hypothetical protein